MFSRDIRRKHGVSSHCKSCKSEYRKNNKEKLNESQRKRRNNNEEYARKQRVRNTLYSEIRAGRLTHPQLCERCGAKSKVEAHHEDYNKPLDVIWLRVDCHHLCHIRK